jgi:multiple sugar transport system ATP-binding protein
MSTTANAIELDHLSKVFAGGMRAVDDVSLSIAAGEFMVLVGPSGCGKTTLLRLIAGLEEATDGEIRVGGRDVTDLAPRQRDIAMVFQSYALYPHMNVEQNLGYGLKVRRTGKDEVRARVGEVAKLLGLEELLARKPAALSGGQRQRVAMGRAIVRQPAAFLMDEPLSNLDAKLRVGMRAELARLHERLGVTTVYVTHDQIEAMTLGQRVAVMREGTLQQVDTPQALYRDPANLFVAAFIGSPSMNLVDATVDGGTVSFAGFRVPLDPRRSVGDGDVVLGIRPQDFEDGRVADPALPRIDVEPAVVEDLGYETLVVFPVEAPPVEADAVRAASDEREAAVLLVAEQRALFTAQVAEGSEARVGKPLTLAVDPSRFHFFGAGTGETLRRRTREVARL